MERYKIDLQQIFGEFFSHDMIDPGFMECELKYDDVVLWIDPIDARKTFNETPSDITTIMGLSIKGFPRAGIVHKPFYSGTFGRTYMGTIESGLY
jgi:hypothetical protein